MLFHTLPAGLFHEPETLDVKDKNGSEAAPLQAKAHLQIQKRPSDIPGSPDLS